MAGMILDGLAEYPGGPRRSRLRQGPGNFSRDLNYRQRALNTTPSLCRYRTVRIFGQANFLTERISTWLGRSKSAHCYYPRPTPSTQERVSPMRTTRSRVCWLVSRARKRTSAPHQKTSCLDIGKHRPCIRSSQYRGRCQAVAAALTPRLQHFDLFHSAPA